MRAVPHEVYKALMEEKRRRKTLVDSGERQYPETFLEYVFTFLTRQAAHKRLGKLKKEFPILADFEFG